MDSTKNGSLWHLELDALEEVSPAGWHGEAQVARMSARCAASFASGCLEEGEDDSAVSEAQLSTACLHRSALMSLCWLLSVAS